MLISSKRKKRKHQRKNSRTPRQMSSKMEDSKSPTLRMASKSPMQRMANMSSKQIDLSRKSSKSGLGLKSKTTKDININEALKAKWY